MNGEYMVNLVPLAIKILRREMKKHPDYAWSWQCNLAMMAYEAGAGIDAANRQAADFMKRCFEVDTLFQYESLDKKLNRAE